MALRYCGGIGSTSGRDGIGIENCNSAEPHDAKEETMWTVFHRLSAVFHSSGDAPKFRRKVLYDDSNRVVDMTEILPNLFIGDEGAAKNTFYLKKVKISHVLNAAEGTVPGHVDTDENFYRVFGIKYKGLKLPDTVQANIAMYFHSASDFIESALEAGGRVLVNCVMGKSRSGTCVLAYMMIKRRQTAVDALVQVRRFREIRPNDGFLRQLADLDNKLRKERGDATSSPVAKAT